MQRYNWHLSSYSTGTGTCQVQYLPRGGAGSHLQYLQLQTQSNLLLHLLCVLPARSLPKCPVPACLDTVWLLAGWGPHSPHRNHQQVTTGSIWLTDKAHNFMPRFDVTRVNFTVPLREHFSLPFIFWQFLSVGHYLKSVPLHSETSHLMAVFISSLIFTLTWQFAQFVLLIQALVLFCLATVGLLDRDRVCRLLAVHLCVMVSVWYLQFYQAMVITSLVVSLVPTAILSLQVTGPSL